MGTPLTDAIEKAQPVKHYAGNPAVMDKVAFVNAQVARGEKERRWFNEQAWLGVAYFAGRQWARFDGENGRLYDAPLEDGEVRRVLNYIKPGVLSVVAKLTQHQPGWLVAPGTNDECDVEAARASDKLLEFEWYETGMRTKLPQIMLWATTTGIGIVRVGWDENLGDEYEEEKEGPGEDGTEGHEAAEGSEADPEEVGQNEDESDGERAPKGKKTGAPTIAACSPFNTILDPGCVEQDLSDCRWIAEIRYLPLDEVRDGWANGKYCTADAGASSDIYAEQLLRDLQKDASSPSEYLADRVRVIYYYERPSRRHKKGLYIVCTSTVMLEANEELPCGELPFAVVRFDAVPGKLYGLGMVGSARDPQDIVNEQVCKRLQTVSLHAAPKWTAEEGSIDANAIDSSPGEVIMFKRGFQRPMPVAPPPISPEHERLEQAGIDHIRQVTGVNEITQGVIPGGISGRAAQWMAELDATKLSLVSCEVEAMCAKLGMLILKFWHAYTPVARTLKVLGQNNRLEVLEFHASEIKSFDVRVQPNSMRVRHPSTKREETLLAWQSGGYGDPKNPDAVAQFRKDMEMGNLEYAQGNQEGESSYAKEENFAYSKGVESEPQPYEDHATHIREHKAQLMSVEFRNEPREVQAALQLHLAKHFKMQASIAAGQPWWDTMLGVQSAPAPADPAPPDAPQPPPPTEAVYGPTEPPPVSQPTPRGAPGIAQMGGGMPQIRGPGVAPSDVQQDNAQR